MKNTFSVFVTGMHLAVLLPAGTRPTGTLLSAIERAAEAAGLAAYRNPATAELRLVLPPGTTAKHLRLYNAQGRLARALVDAVQRACCRCAGCR